jgi:hypothetical protein
VTIIVDSPPIASGNSYITDQNTPLVIGAPGVLGNDSDPENDALTAIFSKPAHGTVSGNPNGGFTYTPAPNFGLALHHVTTKWHNPWWNLDVDNDGYVAPVDAVTVINHVNAFEQHQLNSPPGTNSDFLDVNNDGWVSNADSVAVINYLNSSGPNTPSAPWRNPSSPTWSHGGGNILLKRQANGQKCALSLRDWTLMKWTSWSTGS